MEHEQKTLEFKITNIDTEGRTIEGYAAAFNNVDQGMDVIHPGAFAKTLAERGNKVKLLWQHDRTEPIGKPLELHEDINGLFIKAAISDTARGRDALALLRDGAIDGLSIGYDAVPGGTDYSRDGDKTIRNLREVKLYEFSLVTFPMNESAGVMALKTIWSAAYINDLPDSSFLYIEPGKDKDEDGRTTPRSARHFPYRDADGALDLPHLRNAIGRIPQSNAPGLDDADKERLQNRARRMLEDAQKSDEKAGRRMRGDKTELVRKIRDLVSELEAWADYADGEPEPEEPEEMSKDTAPADAGRVEEDVLTEAGPDGKQATPPTWEEERLAIFLEIESLT